MKVFKKIVKIVVFLAVVAGASYGGYYYWQLSQVEAPLSEQYATEGAAIADIAQTVLTTGNISAYDTLSLYMSRTQTAGTVFVKEGDFIKEGDSLIAWDIEQDRIELERTIAQARLNLENARLGLSLIGQPAQGNERAQYESDVTNAEKNIFDAENDIRSTQIKITQQQRKLEEAEKTLGRNKELLEAGALTQTEYDYAETTYNNALESMEDLNVQLAAKERTLELRETQLEDAQQRLNNALNKLSEQTNSLKYQQQENVIRLNELELSQLEDDLNKLVAETVSPVTGYVSRLHVLEGSAVSKGGLLIELADLSQTVAQADVTEYDAPLLILNQTAVITTSGLPGKEYTGTITKIAAGAVEKEKSSGTERVVPVEITLEDSDELLKTGYSVDIEVYTALREKVLSVPITSLAMEGEQKYVFIMKGDILEKRGVTTGLYGDKRVEITSGLMEGEAVVVNQAEIKDKHKTAA